MNKFKDSIIDDDVFIESERIVKFVEVKYYEVLNYPVKCRFHREKERRLCRMLQGFK